MIDCPKCGARVDGLICHACGERDAGTEAFATPGEKKLSEYGERAAATRRAFEAAKPTANDLTDKQWYAVCKFFPNVAERCRRPRPIVGPDNPLDSVRLGPLFRGLRAPALRRPIDPAEVEERIAIESEAA